MRALVITLMFIISLNVTHAQAETAHLIFTHDNQIWAQPTNGEQVINLGRIRDGFEHVLTGQDVYTKSASPLANLPSEGYGFHHGIWSEDRSQFVYLQIAPPTYQIRRINLGDNSDDILLTDDIRPNMGYLDPIAFTTDGDILLLERRALHHLDKVNIFIFNPDLRQLDFYTSVLPGHLVGRTALLPDNTSVFLGFNFDRQVGIILDTVTQQIQSFAITLNAERKGFEHLPLSVYSAVPQSNLSTIGQGVGALPAVITPRPLPQPFLHWSLADNRRDITCLPDSEWTYVNYSTNCPGLAGRNYEGHQGTDVSQEPDALPIGTPIYPSAVGTVVHAYRGCLGVNPSCNNAYGNTLTLEHVLIVNSETQIWYTGYGHLQMILVEDGAYITDLTKPIALSGATGVGGAHLHFEVRTPSGWVDPWDNRSGQSLWVGGNIRPQSNVLVDDMTVVPRILDVCTSYAGNNIRNGAGTSHQVIGETVGGTTYYIIAIENVQTGEGIGDWYEVLYEGGQGWLWSGVMNCP